MLEDMRRALTLFLVLAACTAEVASPPAAASGVEAMPPVTATHETPPLDARLPAEVRSATFAMG